MLSFLPVPWGILKRYPSTTSLPTQFVYQPSRLFLLVLLAMFVVVLSGCDNPSSEAASTKAEPPAARQQTGPSSVVKTTQPTGALKVDPNAPFPALSGEILKTLEADEPALSKHRETLLKAEQNAIAGAIEAFRAKLKRPEEKVGLLTPLWLPLPVAIGSKQPVIDHSYSFMSSAYAADSTFSGSFGTLQVGAVGWQMASTFGAGMTEDPPSKGESKNVSYKEGGEVKAEIVISGNPPTAEISTRIQNPLFMLDANSKASITGTLCPDTSGKVTLRLALSSQGKIGKNGTMKYGRTLDISATATVGDDGNTLNENIQSKQPDEDPIGSQTLGATALGAAKKYWQNGNCVKIDANSPGTVKPKATSKIPVTVVHKRDGSTVPAKVTAALTGGELVSPSIIPKSPGDVTHVAVDKDGASMTITLKATSRRGNASTDLTITTKGMVFKLDGGADEFHGTGIVCDFEKPFKVSGDGLTLTFTPSSKSSGTYKYSGTLHGFEAWGKGTYTVQYNGDDPVHVTAKGPGTVKTPMGDMTAEGTEEYSVSASQSGCPYGDKLILDN